MRLDRSHRLVIAGVEATATSGYTLVVRLRPDGTLDRSFGRHGRARFRVRSGALVGALVGPSLALQRDGKIVVAGTVPSRRGSEFAVVRLRRSGRLDRSFGNQGRVRFRFPAAIEDVAHAVAVGLDGTILVAGLAYAPDADVAVAALTPRGRLERRFANGGRFLLDLGSGEAATSLRIDAGGRVVVGGFAGPGDDRFLLLRLTAGGRLDGSFGNGGVTTTAFANVNADAKALLLRRNGKIVLAGTIDPTAAGGFALAQYRANGMLDTGFGSGGTVTTGFGGCPTCQIDRTAPVAATRLRHGTIVVVGTLSDNNAPYDDVALAAYRINGQLARRFGARGRLRVDFHHRVDLGIAVAPGPKHSVIALGNGDDAAHGDRIELARIAGASG